MRRRRQSLDERCGVDAVREGPHRRAADAGRQLGGAPRRGEPSVDTGLGRPAQHGRREVAVIGHLETDGYDDARGKQARDEALGPGNRRQEPDTAEPAEVGRASIGESGAADVARENHGTRRSVGRQKRAGLQDHGDVIGRLEESLARRQSSPWRGPPAR